MSTTPLVDTTKKQDGPTPFEVWNFPNTTTIDNKVLTSSQSKEVTSTTTTFDFKGVSANSNTPSANTGDVTTAFNLGLSANSSSASVDTNEVTTEYNF